ncbi:MAG: DUF1496 domain-containing protein [Leptolyngbya sp. SIO4C1]|nr:DUF1496 domain-containing protein [Leptolyngbya sp. SIO4C1]
MSQVSGLAVNNAFACAATGRTCLYEDKSYSIGAVLCMPDQVIYACTASGWTARPGTSCTP